MKKIFFAVVTFLFVSDVSAQSLRSLQTDVDDMREEITVLQRRLYSKETGLNMDPENGADVLVRVGEMEENVRDVVGRMDVIEHQIKELNNRLDLINKDMDIRMKMLEGKQVLGSDVVDDAKLSNNEITHGAVVAKDAPKSLTGDSVKGGDLEPAEGTSVAEIYQKGLNDLKDNDFDKAEAAFEKILKKHGEDKLAGNAQYWLGEVYYGKKDFEKAAIAFAKGYQNYKDSPKGADSLLKLGMSMVSLKKNEEACAAFKSLPKEFPKAGKELKDKASAEAKKLSCK